MTGGRRGRRYGCCVNGRRMIGWKRKEETMQVIRLLGELGGRSGRVYDVWRSRVCWRAGGKRDVLRIQGMLSALEGMLYSVLGSMLGSRAGSVLQSVLQSALDSIVESVLGSEEIAAGGESDYREHKTEQESQPQTSKRLLLDVEDAR